MILTPKQMTAAEQYAVKCGISLGRLMDNAGYELGRFIRKTAMERLTKGELSSKKIVILCGRGNNGGDGFVCANHLCADGFDVTVCLVCGKPKTELAINAFSKLSQSVKVVENDFSTAFEGCSVIVDAVFGTGFHGELPENITEIFNLADKYSGLKIACDMPSGVNCLTGETSFGTMKFDFTVTFHAEKIGCLMKPAKSYCGDMVTVDIEIPKESEKYSEYEIIKVNGDFPFRNLPKRPENGHKGTFGKLLCLCGSDNYRGAAALSATAAMRTGVGLVELFSSEKVISGMWGLSPEIIYTPCDFSTPYRTAMAVVEKARKASAILIGCGITKSLSNLKMIEAIIKNVEIPVIIDADGINSLSLNINVLSGAKAKIVLTPHPAELARLCRVSLSDAAAGRLDFAVKLSKEFNTVVMAKGAGTFIADSDTDKVYFADFGNTALSKGGSGDMLAGITGSLIAQGVSPAEACAAASILLGVTSEKLSESASQRGIVASDILSALPCVMKELSI